MIQKTLSLPESSNCRLRGFLEYLKGQGALSHRINTQLLESDLHNGWELSSDIPAGAGMGSSGAVVAAVYDRYAQQKTDDLFALKNLFAQMENYFHGKSSGI